MVYGESRSQTKEDLPTTGKEEDAVDQLSTYVLAYESEEGEAPALHGATQPTDPARCIGQSS